MKQKHPVAFKNYPQGCFNRFFIQGNAQMGLYYLLTRKCQGGVGNIGRNA